MNLSTPQALDIESIKGITGFFVLEAPSKIIYCSEVIRLKLDSLLSLTQKLFSLGELTFRSPTEEIQATYDNGHFNLKPIVDGSGCFLVGIVSMDPKSIEAAQKLILETKSS